MIKTEIYDKDAKLGLIKELELQLSQKNDLIKHHVLRIDQLAQENQSLSAELQMLTEEVSETKQEFRSVIEDNHRMKQQKQMHDEYIEQVQNITFAMKEQSDQKEHLLKQQEKYVEEMLKLWSDLESKERMFTTITNEYENLKSQSTLEI